MQLKVELFNEHFGRLVLDDEPAGLDALEVELKRSQENDGVFYEFTMNLDWHGQGREYLAQIFEAFGPEAHVSISVYRYDDNRYTWELYFSGKLKLSNYRIDSIFASTNIEQTGFQRKFINLMDRDVSFSDNVSHNGVQITPVTPLNLTLHGKKILKMLRQGPANSDFFAFPSFHQFDLPATGGGFAVDALYYAQFDFSNQEVQDLQENVALSYGQPLALYKTILPLGGGSTADRPPVGSLAFYDQKLRAHKDVRNYVYKALEAGTVDVEISVNAQHTLSAYQTDNSGDVDICGSGVLGHTEIWAWFEHRAANDDIKSLDLIGKWDSIEGCGGYGRTSQFERKLFRKTGVVAEIGDEFYCYYTIRIHGEYQAPGVFGGRGFVFHDGRIRVREEETYIRISSNTTVPDSQARAVLVHEAFQHVVESNTDQTGTFYSEHFGRTDIGYEADGKGAARAILNGRAIRQQIVQTLFINWQELFAAMNSIDCLSWGFERRNGQEIVRVEPKSHFYNKNSIILEIAEVAKLEKRNAMNLYYSQIECGYQKIEVIQQENGMDEFNMPRRYTMPLTQATGKLQITCPFRASGFELEYERRLKGKSQESRLDDANFIVCLQRSNDSWATERNEDFPDMRGVLNADTIYNARISPGRNIRNWSQVLACNLTRQQNKTLRFSYGELNYQMESRANDEQAIIHEGADVDLTHAQPLWLPETYHFEARLSPDEFKLIRENPYGVVKFRDEHGNVKEGYVLNVKHKPSDNLGTFELLRVYRPQ